MSAITALLKELRSFSRKFRKLAEGCDEQGIPDYAEGMTHAAEIIEKRIGDIGRAECLRHRKPRPRYVVTRCKRCGKLVEKEVD